MNRLVIIALALIFSTQLQSQEKAKRYAIKSGMISYKLTGNTKGTKTVYFDNYGDKTYEHEKSETVTKMFGITDRSETDKIVIINQGHFWEIDNLKGSNYEGTLAYYHPSKQFTNNMTEAEQKKLADDLLASFGGERLGTVSFLGRTCDKISVMGSVSLIYKGIILKSETKVMGIEANETATKLEENTSINASKFEAPSGISFTDITKQQQALMSDMDSNMNAYEEDDDDDDDLIPVEYPFAQFQEVAEGFTPDGYARTMVMTQDGQHVAIFNQGFTNIISIVATSMDNMENEDEFDSFESFTHNGKTMRYGDLSESDMDGKALVIPYKNENMYIIVLTSPGQDKATMVEMSDNLDF